MVWRIDADWLICALGHCEFDGHTVHKLSQRHLTANWLAPWENDWSQMHSKVSSDWLPSYIKATWPVLKLFKMAAHFSDRPGTVDNWACVCIPFFTQGESYRNILKFGTPFTQQSVYGYLLLDGWFWMFFVWTWTAHVYRAIVNMEIRAFWNVMLCFWS